MSDKFYNIQDHYPTAVIFFIIKLKDVVFFSFRSDGSMVKSRYYSDIGPEFSSQYPRQAAHTALGIQP